MDTIVTIARDEDNFVCDFVLYHCELGFERVVIFDDQSLVPIEDTLASLPERVRAKVQCLRLDTEFYEWKQNGPEENVWDDSIFAKYSESKQMYFCNFAVKKLLDPRDWVALIDVDEFVWLGTCRSIGELREQIACESFEGMIFDMLVYGHGFNLVPPRHNNICAFNWRARRIYGHGKFFGRVGAVRQVGSPHFPTLHDGNAMCDGLMVERPKEFSDNRWAGRDLTQHPHIRHFMIQDVYSCFRRRLRKRISTAKPVAPTDPFWTARMNMLDWTSELPDYTLSTQLLSMRARMGLPFTDHAAALLDSASRVGESEDVAGLIDIRSLAQSVGMPDSEDAGTILFRYFSQPEPDLTALRFCRMPSDFVPQRYQALYRDLAELSDMQLRNHYAKYGIREGRRFQDKVA